MKFHSNEVLLHFGGDDWENKQVLPCLETKTEKIDDISFCFESDSVANIETLLTISLGLSLLLPWANPP